MFIKLITILAIAMTFPSRADQTLYAGVFNIVPYGYIENERIVGITPDIIREIERRSKIKIKLNIQPYKRMLNSLNDGIIDFSIFFLSEASAKASDKLIDLYDLDTIAIARKGITIIKNEDLLKYNIVTPRGVKYNTKILNDPKMNIHYVLDYNVAIRMLLNNRTDVIIGPQKILDYQIDTLGLNRKIFQNRHLITRNTAWLQFSKVSKKKKFKKSLVKAVLDMKEENQIDKIVNQHYQSKFNSINNKTP
ncbi:hypothetical protein A9Q84_16875 [Halobacteriovorax marinus]|uniref:Solute-binding protein family 3/N-terminal domain-containing protein n=1 Tax=Halobacteriovorax marinus TaxID=97084 RepID=A0A1Y5F4K0_9BACT|nr:hypothetical protein A9Q84_16875 [Halobacteriovorax marinus]